MICSSGIGFDPVVAETPLEFGFHGIWQGTAVIYDKGTRSLWLHLTGECISGRHKGKQLKPIPGRHVQWWEWKRDHPDTRVMAPVPAFEEQYFPKINARRGHDFFPSTFPSTIHSKDARLAPSALLYGIVAGDAARCYPFARLLDADSPRVINEMVGDVAVVVLFDPETRSAFGHGRRLGDTTLILEQDAAGRLRDPVSGSLFDRDGFAVTGPLKGQRLPQLHSMQAEWYGWFAAYPNTSIWGK